MWQPPERGLFEPNTQHDMLDLVPLERADGSAILINPENVARIGERDTLFADFVRSCNLGR